ncbi:MAG: DUF3100 domain-containing protein [Clostridium sp.]|nr:DUF3100 domain-containing protein [Clostridium sp.]
MKKDKTLFIGFILLIIFISEMIGVQGISIGSIRINVLPLVFAVIIAMIIGMSVFRKGVIKKIYSKENVNFAGKHLIFIMLPLMARYGADVAPKINEILEVGWIFLLQSVGNIGTVLLGLPVALLLGLKRESIGATLGIGREGELAYISEKFTVNSDEGRGVLSIYLVGTLFGAVIFSIIPPILSGLGFDYRALAIGSGLGSASMMTAASTSLIPLYAGSESTITSYAAASQLVTSFMGTYIMVFLSIPLMNFMYKIFKKEKAI